MTAFGKFLAELRGNQGLSQSELARRAGLDHSHVSRMEGGSRRPRRETLAAVAATLELGPFTRAKLFELAGHYETGAAEHVRVVRMTALEDALAGLMEAERAIATAKSELERVIGYGPEDWENALQAEGGPAGEEGPAEDRRADDGAGQAHGPASADEAEPRI